MKNSTTSSISNTPRSVSMFRPFLYISIGTAGLLLSACEKAEIRVYEAPKDEIRSEIAGADITRATPRQPAAEPQLPGDQLAQADTGMPTPPTADTGSQQGSGVPAPQVNRELHWTVPDSWVEQPGNQFRRGSYEVQGEQGTADVSIIALGGDAGGIGPNVNRWRSQLDLEPWEQQDFAENAQIIEIMRTPAAYVGFSGPGSGQMTPPMAQGQAPDSENGDGGMNRIIAAILPFPGETWFFKMTGPEELVKEQEQLFREFLGSIHSAHHDTDPTHDAGHAGSPFEPSPGSADQAASTPAQPQAQSPQSGRMTQRMTGSVDNAQSGEGLEYDVPEGWESADPGPVRAASFNIPNPDGDPGDVSVTALGGMSGSILANVNRWRGQLGLEPVQSVADAQLQDVQVDGIEGKLMEIHSESQAMSAAIIDKGATTWFFKMTGPRDVVEENRETFTNFLGTVKLPAGS